MPTPPSDDHAAIARSLRALAARVSRSHRPWTDALVDRLVDAADAVEAGHVATFGLHLGIAVAELPGLASGPERLVAETLSATVESADGVAPLRQQRLNLDELRELFPEMD